ncbi:MAG: hypothetical protein CL943_00705 [Candidatus Diapherotrites archaeon]|uniref:Nucleotidyl transferase domain-containing protein n=1 Tax=Candidatus Iainarchaeum sp. TaxID=3101447 RepID=A0A2D6M072_9ARCH|nr:hypothetical protein [Candidatus Diapherotrites archaeon]|tara:strand:+ start:4975 stop:5718 length:744 start_codon:yes stop_codon:yes gene_type:complete
MKAIIPAAGYATRMYPLTKDKAKPLLEVKGKKMVEHVIGKISEISDVNEIFVVTNAKFYDQFVEWSKGFESKIPIKILNDGTTSNEDRLGSMGDINFVIESEKIEEEIIIVNSDNLFTFELTDLTEFFKEKGTPVIGLYDTRSIEEAKKMGNPEIDDSNRVVGFVEKPPEPKSTLCSVGIYAYTKEGVAMIKQYLDEGNPPDKTGDFVDWLYQRTPVYGFVFDKPEDKWFDIGSLETYEEAKKDFPG